MLLELTTFLLFVLAVFGAASTPTVLQSLGSEARNATWWPIDDASRGDARHFD